MKRLLLLIVTIITAHFCKAQTSTAEPLMQQNGKIYVVVAVVVTILIGLFVYVWSLDRKISKMEKGQ